MTARTSASDPIRVDFLPVAALPLPGRVGTTFAPGKRAPGAAGAWARALDADLERLARVYATTRLVSLVTDAELAQLGIGRLVPAAEALGIAVTRFPITDGGTPELAAAVELVASILEGAHGPANVVLHCRGGLGRAGTIAACTLVAAGHAPHEAIAVARTARPGAVETFAQERFVERFAEAWRRAIAARIVAPVRLGARDPGAPRLSAFRGALLGGALGDALGFPIEFTSSPAVILARHGHRAPRDLLARSGDSPRVSDDTQMTLFTAEGIIRGAQRRIDRGIASIPDSIRRALLRWYATQSGRANELADWPGWLVREPGLHARRAPGGTCLAALHAMIGGREPGTVARPPNDSKGCGAVMRSAPIGLAAGSRELAFATARDAAALTHGHPSGYLSAALFASIVHDVARGTELPIALDLGLAALVREPGHDEVLAVACRARDAAGSGPPSPAAIASIGAGWTGEEALGIALLCALTADASSPEGIAEALWRAVAHGGDSDSTGSLTGNLLGAMAWLEGLPPRWLEQLELRDVIDRVACDLYASAVLGSVLDFESYPPN